MLATEEEITLTYTDLHLSQTEIDSAWHGDGSGMITHGPVLAFTVKQKLPLTAEQTVKRVQGCLKGEAAKKHLMEINQAWGGRSDDDTLTALTPLQFFLHHTRKTYDFLQFWMDMLLASSVHLDQCIHIDNFYESLAGYPTDMWPCLIHMLDLAANGTGDTGTIRKLMGKPWFPSTFDTHHTLLITKAFDSAHTYVKEGVYNKCPRSLQGAEGIPHPTEYHTVRQAFVAKHAPSLMAAINAHYTDTWNVTLPQSTKILHSLYYSVCDNEERDDTLTQWLALHVPTLHRDTQAPTLIPLL